jgi:putative phosphonate metabolism protein
MTGPGGARYAIYFVPAAESDLYRFGRSILGYDCYAGEDVPFEDDLDLSAGDWRELTNEPRRYGFHATLKAPFHLASNCTETQLTDALLSFAKSGHQETRFEPGIRALGDFIAIVPREASPLLNALANACTITFDAFRAPMTAHERERRAVSRLSASQVQNLDRWGYPYVFEDFRFHMTLTGPASAAAREEILATLRRTFGRVCGKQEIAVDRLALVKQDHARARFRVLGQAELGR